MSGNGSHIESHHPTFEQVSERHRRRVLLQRAGSILRQLIEEKGVIVRGHFIGFSGRHLDAFVDKTLLLADAQGLKQMALGIATLFADLKPDVVVGPKTGGAILASHVIRFLETDRDGERPLFVFSENDRGPHAIKRQFAPLVEGKRALIVDDVVTSGSTLHEVLDAVLEVGGVPVGVGVALNRDAASVNQNSFPVLFQHILDLGLKSYTEEEMPERLRLIPVSSVLGHGKDRGKP